MSVGVSKSFDTPDELRTPPGASVAVVDLDGPKVARLRLEPGWRWSESVKPIVGTETCQVHHLGVIVSGAMHVVDADGVGSTVAAGTAYVIQPGHDAWVVGDEPVVAFEFDQSAATNYATPSS
jgi:hypothetical protein